MVMNMANLLTLFRIVAIVPVVILILVPTPTAAWFAAGIYTIAAATDYFDGLVARHLGEVSRFGRLMDPIADKLLVSSVLLFLAGTGQVTGVHLFAALIVLARELFVSGLREFLVTLKQETPVSKLAKVKTFVQLCSLGFLIWAPGLGSLGLWASELGLVLLWCAALLSLRTGYAYARQGFNYLREAAPGAAPNAVPRTVPKAAAVKGE